MKFRFSLGAVLALAILPFLAIASDAAAQAPKNISMTVGVCDPAYGTRCAKPDINGAIPVTISGSTGSSTVKIDQTTPGTTNGVQTLSGSTTAVTQATAANLNAQVQGATAAAAANAGNPVKVGCVYNSAGVSVTSGNLSDVQCDNAGGLRVFGAAVSGSGGGNNFVQVGGQDGAFTYRQFRTDTGGSQLISRIAPGTSITAASGNVANANAVATLAGATGKTTAITGFQCTAAGATAASVVNLTVAGVVTGTMTYTFAFPAGATTLATPLIVAFATPVVASATNTAIVVTLPAGGTGNTNAACSAQGYQL